MDYREAIIAKIDSYYREVIENYKETTTAAMKAAKKLSLFKKQDFSVHIEGFRNHMINAAEYKVRTIEIPSTDGQAKVLMEKFEKSVDSFCHLCKISMDFYELTEKKQYRGSNIRVSDYKLAYNVMQDALADAVSDLDELDKEYREYAPKKFAN